MSACREATRVASPLKVSPLNMPDEPETLRSRSFPCRVVYPEVSSSSELSSEIIGGLGTKRSSNVWPGWTSSDMVWLWIVVSNSSLKYVNLYGASSTSRRHAAFRARSRPSTSSGSFTLRALMPSTRSSFSMTLHSSRTARSGHALPRCLLVLRLSRPASLANSSSAISDRMSCGKHTSSSAATVSRLLSPGISTLCSSDSGPSMSISSSPATSPPCRSP